MKKNILIFSGMMFILLALSPGCSKKGEEPAGAPGEGAVQTPAGEKAQAQGTADTLKTSETRPENPGNCTYRTDPKTIGLEWTAYKTTDKVPVKGHFNTTAVQGPVTAPSLAKLAEGLRMDIDGASIESGDPGRNLTVKDFFFGKFNPPFKMQAIAKKLTGDDTGGNLMIEIDMNGVTREVPFAYTVNGQGELTAKGGINLMDWQLKSAFDSIHQACEQLHTGKDGISKTWDVVDLEIKGQFTKDCPGAEAP